MQKPNYQKQITAEGHIIEAYGTYEDNPASVSNPPEMLSKENLQTILGIMRENNIKKLDIIY